MIDNETEDVKLLSLAANIDSSLCSFKAAILEPSKKFNVTGPLVENTKQSAQAVLSEVEKVCFTLKDDCKAFQEYVTSLCEVYRERSDDSRSEMKKMEKALDNVETRLSQQCHYVLYKDVCNPGVDMPSQKSPVLNAPENPIIKSEEINEEEVKPDNRQSHQDIFTQENGKLVNTECSTRQEKKLFVQPIPKRNLSPEWAMNPNVLITPSLFNKGIQKK